jgi:2-hydroxychromene-2-carboxylate isomerase
VIVSDPSARFYFDLSSPLAYLAAERILHVLPGPAEWQPVLSSRLTGEQSFHAFEGRAEQERFRSDIARHARELGLQPLRWPDPFPFDSALAMRVATYAKSIGRVVPFAQAAFRQAFAGGRSLEDPDYVLIAAAACEMHPTAVLSGARLRSVADQLAAATADASSAGIIDVPAVLVEGTRPGGLRGVFTGERAVEQAAAHMRADARAARASGAGSR